MLEELANIVHMNEGKENGTKRLTISDDTTKGFGVMIVGTKTKVQKQHGGNSPKDCQSYVLRDHKIHKRLDNQNGFKTYSSN